MSEKYDVQQVIREIRSLQGYEEAEQIVRKNSEGKIWLVGGSVYRTMARVRYGIKQPQVDFDFLVERLNGVLQIPKGRQRWDWSWVGKEYSWDFPRFTSVDGLQVDLLNLSDVHSIRQRCVQPTLENYLTGVPLTIQSIVFDIDKNIIIGGIGLQALQEKTVEVNNFAEAAYTSTKSRKFLHCEDEDKAITEGRYVHEYVSEKAKSVGFKPVLNYEKQLNTTLIAFIGSESPQVRCAICHDDFKEEHRICENKNIAGQYLHTECRSMLGAEVIDLNVTYGTLVKLATQLQQKEQNITPQQLYERLQREFSNPSVFRQVYTFFKKTFTREKRPKNALKKE